MSFLFIIAYFYECMLLLAGILAAIRYPKASRSTRYIFYWIWLGVFTEGCSDISVALWHTNMQVYGISSLIELFILCGYFNESVPSLKRKGIGLLIGEAGVLLGILNFLFLQPLGGLNSNFLFLECLVIVCLSLYALYRMFAEPDLKLLKETHFWFACLLVFYECIGLWDWGIYDYVLHFHTERLYLVNYGLIIGNIITYIACGIIIYQYPKMRRTYV